MDHDDPILNILIHKLKRIREKRLKTDLHLIVDHFGDTNFFSEKGITGHDLCEIAECMTYSLFK